MEALEVDDATGIWDSATRTFAPVPPKRVIDRTAFIERFTMAEWVGLVALKPSDSIMAAVFERLALLDQVDLDSAFVQAAAAHCVQQGHLSQERMAEVLA